MQHLSKYHNHVCKVQNETGEISHQKSYTKINLAVNGITVNFKRMTNKLHNKHDNMNNQKNKTFFCIFKPTNKKYNVFRMLFFITIKCNVRNDFCTSVTLRTYILCSSIC